MTESKPSSSVLGLGTETVTSGSVKVRWKRRHTISPRHYFRLYGGGALRDLADLHRALETMTDEQFDHHVNGERNDFAVWLEEVFGERVTAEHLRQSQSREEMKHWIEGCLYF